MDWFQSVGFMLEPGYERASGWGNNPDIDLGGPEVVDPLGGTTIPWLSSATSLEIVSDSAADAAAGTGARTVSIDGLNANYSRVSQTVTLNGTTALASFMAEPGLVLPERSRFWLQVNAVSGNNTDVTAAWWGILKLNSAL